MARTCTRRRASTDGRACYEKPRALHDCWLACGKTAGLCAACGAGRACCAFEANQPKECPFHMRNTPASVVPWYMHILAVV